jgi:hypothetical protein
MVFRPCLADSLIIITKSRRFVKHFFYYDFRHTCGQFRHIPQYIVVLARFGPQWRIFSDY